MPRAEHVRQLADLLRVFDRLVERLGEVVRAEDRDVYKKYEKETGDTTKTVIASTASPYKFTRSVMNAIDSSYDSKTDFELIDELEKLSGVKVPQAIEDIRSAAVLHDTVCETEDMCKEVKKILNIK